MRQTNIKLQSNGTPSAHNAVSRVVSCASAIVLLAASVGCGSGAYQLSDTSPVVGSAIQGTVHGGQNPISGTTVQLWAIGSTGYGTGASKLGSSVKTGSGTSAGVFTLGTFTCPTMTTPVYLVGTGTGANANIALMAALGSCGSIPSNIQVNEVTTVAAAFALSHYFTTTFGSTGTDGFGAPSTTQAQLGITNAFATVANLVSNSTGVAVTSSTFTNAGFTITTTPESGKLYTIANIIAACVNSAGGVSGDSSVCGTLFADSVTASGTAPTDTLQAAVYMCLNPTSTNGNSGGSSANLTALYGLATGTGSPFVGPASSSQPSDWTIGIQYTDTTAGTPVLTDPLALAFDASGNLWVANNGSGASGALGEIGPTGTPMVGTTFPAAAATLVATNPRNIAVDTSGNVWLTTSSGSGYLFEYVPSTAAVTTTKLGKSSYGLAIDGNNDVFVGEESSSDSSETTAPLGPYGMYEFVAGNTGSYVGFPLDGSTNILRPEYLAVDTSGNVWANDGSDQTTTVIQIAGITPCTGTGTPPTCAVTQTSTQNVYTTVTSGSPNAPYGVAAANGGIWYADRTGNALTFLSLTGATVNSGTAYGSSTTLSAPKFIAVDGGGNVWTAANNETSPGSISELSSTGVVLSPANTGTMPFNVIGYSHAGITTGAGMAVDPSGNVWVANNLATGTSSTSVFELVGAGVPTVTPIALALKNGKVGQEP